MIWTQWRAPLLNVACWESFVAFLLALVLAGSVAAQSGPALGTPPFGSFAGGPDIINLSGNNVRLAIPILRRPGRGIDFQFSMTYDSLFWIPLQSGSTKTWTPLTLLGWGTMSSAFNGVVSRSATRILCPDGTYATQFSNWTYADQIGNVHQFSVVTNNCVDGLASSSGMATDGSGFFLNVVNNVGTASSPTGTTFTLPSGYSVPGISTYLSGLTDRNGNILFYTYDSNNNLYLYDSLSTSAPVLTRSGSGTAASPMVYAYTPPNTSSSTCATTNTPGVVCYTVNYTNYTVATNFGVSGIAEYKSSAAVPLVSSIVLPDGSQYSFTYEPTPGSCTPYSGTTCVTARLTSITLPTRGVINYAYSGGPGGTGIYADGTTATLARTTPDGNWVYARTLGSGAASTNTITDPQNNQTAVQFQGSYETQRKAYQGSTSGTLLETINTCYNGSSSPCTSTAVTPPITLRSVVEQYGSSGLQCQQNYFYNSTGGLTEQDDYDYGSGAPLPLLKQVLVIYASLGNNINSVPQQVTVKNSAGTIVAQKTYNYDETTPAPTSGIVQHTSVSGSRGNLTSINYPVSGLTAHFTYYDTGSPQTSQDVNGATTTYNYSNNTADCQMAFPTSISEPLNLSRSMSWNCTGGVMAQLADENGNISYTSYNDPYYWRPSSTTDQTGVTTNICYAALTSSGCPATLSTNQIETYLNFNSNNSTVDTLTTLDGLGRVHVRQTRQGPAASNSNFDSVETDYDALGRVNRVTVPYTGTAGQTNTTIAATSTTYDALSRISQVTDGGGGTATYTYSATSNDVLIAIGPAPVGESLKRRQLEYNSLGWLTSVCEITSGTSPWPGSTCAQNTSATGYWTKYTFDALGNLLTVTQNAQSSTNQQTRSYVFDAMSRLTSETNAESGTTNYTYDTDTTCGTSSGDLVKRADAVGNTICYVRDTLHRVTSQLFYGPNAANQQGNRYFVYDTATVNAQAMQNGKSRLVEAFTAGCSTCSKITDAGFSYTARGEVSDAYQSTPNSGGWYHVTQTYWPHGAPNQLSGLTGLPTITYGGTIGTTVGLDGEGRITQVTASGTGVQNPVTGVIYNPASLPTQVNFGSGDSDIFGYDANTLRMSQLKFNAGSYSQSLTGTLTWNANNTLGQLAITDQFNSANMQTCNYVHDDLTRLASANCGTAAAQTFTYDAFGNINKSGSPNSFQPTYSAATNRMTSLPGGFTPTYDANGNVTNDSNHTYAWDTDGNSVTVDGVGLTFDALDRMVEQNRSGTYTQIVYAPTGDKLALMNGQSLVKAFIPLPGQATAVYTSSGLDHYRHSDWLGSARLTSSPSQTYVSSVAYAPFGETYAQSGTADLSFTRINSDTTGDDYDFLFREYSTQGRWASPDPAGLAAVNPANPQSWNRYSYVRNNPLALIDAFGLCGSSVNLGAGPCDDGVVLRLIRFAANDYAALATLGWSFLPAATVQTTQTLGALTDYAVIYEDSAYFPPTWMLLPIPDRPRGNSSWWGTFAKEFFKLSGGPGNVPTCAEVALQNIGQEFIPFSPSGASVIQATAPAAQAMAFNSAVAQTTASVDAYVAAGGLTVPLRSTVVRGMIAQGAESAVAAGARANVAVQTLAVDYAAIKSTVVTAGQARSGLCAAAFPIF